MPNKISKKYVISKEHFIEVARPFMLNIFNNDEPDAYELSFNPKTEGKVILTAYFYGPEPPLSDALIKTIKKFGEKDFFLTALGHSTNLSPNSNYHWKIPVEQLSKITHFIGPLDNVMYSTTGLWGITSGDENHGLLGASLEFIDELRKNLPSLDDLVLEMLALWDGTRKRNNLKIEWLPPLLEHVFGSEKAQSLLNENGFEDMTS